MLASGALHGFGLAHFVAEVFYGFMQEDAHGGYGAACDMGYLLVAKSILVFEADYFALGRWEHLHTLEQDGAKLARFRLALRRGAICRFGLKIHFVESAHATLLPAFVDDTAATDAEQPRRKMGFDLSFRRFDKAEKSFLYGVLGTLVVTAKRVGIAE